MAETLFKRFIFTAAAAAAMSFASGAYCAPAASEAPTAAPAAANTGVVGVCVRWGDDAHHLADAVVVEPSGNAVLDTVVPNTLRSMDWDKPSGYAGEWLGLSVGVDGAKPSEVLPSCDSLGGATSGTPLVAEKAVAT